MIKSAGTPKKSSKAQSKENGGDSIELSFVGADQLILMVEIHKKIMAFRDIMDLAPCNSSASLREVCDYTISPINALTILASFFLLCYVTLQIVIRTLHDLQKFYPKIISKNQLSRIKNKHIDQVAAYKMKLSKLCIIFGEMLPS